MSQKRVKDYRIINMIGKGGMAAIYLAEHVTTGEKVALKVLLPHMATDRDFVMRFLHEVKANEKLNHKNIVKIKDCDEFQGRYFMVMEFVNGLTLHEIFRVVPVLPLTCALFIFRQILEGLQYSHTNNVIHRDMKPSNILISIYGAVKITDFGISKVTDLTKLTQTGSVLGTPAYMSPEQARGIPVDQRCDIFSTGIMFYEALSGISPFATENPSTTMFNVLQKDPELPSELNPTIPSAMEAILERMIMKDRDHRYPSVEQITQDFERYKSEIGDPCDRALFIKFMQNPKETAKEITLKDSLNIRNHAAKLLKGGEFFEKQAMWEYYKVLYLNPDDSVALDRLTQLCLKHGFKLETDRTEKIINLEKEYQNNPDNVAIMMQLAKAHRLNGNFFEVIKYYKKLKRLKPDDVYFQGQIDALLGDKTLATEMATQIDLKPVRAKKHKPVATQGPVTKIDVVQVKSKSKKPGKIGYIVLGALILGTVGFFWWAVSSFMKTSSQLLNTDYTSTDSAGKNPGQGISRTGMTDDALSQLDKAEEAYNNKNYTGARDLYLNFRKKYPDLKKYDVMLRLIQIDVNVGEYDTALEKIERFLPENTDPYLAILAHLERIHIYGIQRRFYDIEIEYENILNNLDMITNVEFCVSTLLDYGDFLRLHKKFSRAVEIGQLIIDKYSGQEFQIEARNLLADIYIDRGDPGNAILEYRKILENMSPDQMEYAEIENKIKAIQNPE